MEKEKETERECIARTTKRSKAEDLVSSLLSFQGANDSINSNVSCCENRMCVWICCN